MTVADAAVIALQAATAIFQFTGSRLIERQHDLHPFFKVCKNMIVALAVYALLGRLLGASGEWWFPLIFWGVLAGYAFFEWRAILRRSRRDPLLRIRTQRGVAWVDDEREAAFIISAAASIIRHQRFDGQQYVSEEAIEEVLDALDVAPASDMVANIRRQMEERRIRLAEEGIMAAEVDIFLREIKGTNEQ